MFSYSFHIVLGCCPVTQYQQSLKESEHKFIYSAKDMIFASILIHKRSFCQNITLSCSIKLTTFSFVTNTSSFVVTMSKQEETIGWAVLKIKIMWILFVSKMSAATHHCVSHNACGCCGRERHDGRSLGETRSRIRNGGCTECPTQKTDRVPFSSTPPASEIPLKGACQDHKKSFTSHLYTHTLQIIIKSLYRWINRLHIFL